VDFTVFFLLGPLSLDLFLPFHRFLNENRLLSTCVSASPVLCPLLVFLPLPWTF